MATIRIDLQGGFDGDDVEVLVDGERVHHEAAATTSLATDLAASFPLEAPDGHVEVTVRLPRRGLETSTDVLAAGETYVVARVEDGRLLVEQLADEPYYL